LRDFIHSPVCVTVYVTDLRSGIGGRHAVDLDPSPRRIVSRPRQYVGQQPRQLVTDEGVDGLTLQRANVGQ
jgi:hypothetical protein